MGKRALLLLPVLLLSALPARAADPPGFVRKLTPASIDAFLHETQAVLSGTHPEGVSIDDMGNYFVNHLGDAGVFRSTIRFEIPDHPAQERPLVLNKQAYIENLVQGRLTLRDYRAGYEKVAAPVIAADGKSATIAIRTVEQGYMPVNDKGGETVMMPFAGVSECAETLAISWNHFIQVTGAECRTVLRVGEP